MSQLWAGVDVGKEHHWVVVVDDTGAVKLSRKLVNDEQPIRALVAEIGAVIEHHLVRIGMLEPPELSEQQQLLLKQLFLQR